MGKFTRLSTLLLPVIASLILVQCAKKLDDADIEESGQSVSDEMSSADEGMSGFQATRELTEELDASFDKLKENELAASSRARCFQTALTACAAGVRTRTFDSCTRLGGATWKGKVKLSFSGATCNIAATNDSVTRTVTGTDGTGAMTVTGRKSATISVTTDATTTWDSVAISGGQKITRTAPDTFSFEVLGINRSAKSADGTELFNISRKTSEALTITGSARASRTVTGGKLVAYHNKAKFNVTWVPTSVKWDGSCLCPVSGSMAGTLSGGRTGTVNLTFTGCGTATVESDSKKADIELDSCEASS